MRKALIIVLLFLLIACGNNKQTENIKAYEMPIQISQGINLGNSLDCASRDRGFTLDTEEFWHNPITTKELIDNVAELNIDCIRVPVSYLNHVDEDYNIDPKWLDRVEEVVRWCLDNDLYTIINVHHDTGMNPSLNWIFADADNYEENLNKYIKLWTQIALRFKDYDEHLIFQGSGEWMNPERNWNRSDSYEDFEIVHKLNQEFINCVRNTGFNNAERYLMISPFSASGELDIIEAMFKEEFHDTAENRLILSVHSYELDINRIYEGGKYLAELSLKHKMPVVVDEFGYSIKNSRSRNIASAKAFNEISNSYKIPLIIWDDGYEYKLFDRNDYSISDNEIYQILFD